MKLTKKFYLKFLIMFNLNIFAIQQNSIIAYIAFRLNIFIISLHVKFLNRIKQMMANN